MYICIYVYMYICIYVYERFKMFHRPIAYLSRRPSGTLAQLMVGRSGDSLKGPRSQLT